MARENVRFNPVKIVRKPTRVKFKTKSGKTVSFKAVKIVRKRNSKR